MSGMEDVRNSMRLWIAERGRGGQARLAEEMGVTPATVSRWLANSMAIQPRHFTRLAQVLGLPSGTIEQLHLEQAAREGKVVLGDDQGVRYVTMDEIEAQLLRLAGSSNPADRRALQRALDRAQAELDEAQRRGSRRRRSR